ncbi:MAG: hypothetical protein AAF721_29870 [Myxococcota bacterium]
MVWCALVVSALGTSGCARRTDARSKSAFDSARGRGASKRQRQSEVVSGGGSGVFEQRKVGWARVDEMLGHAVSTLRAAPDDSKLAELAARWCAVEPEPRDTVDGPVLVCNPDPPIIVGGTSFSLELGGDGVIGFVAADLSSADSTRVAAEARKTAKHWCAEPWAKAATTDVADPTSHTCEAEGGPLLAVSRFPTRPGSDRWLVSVAVLTPG